MLGKVFFIMNKKSFQKLTTKKFCILSLLVAITAILSIYCTFRVGNAIKIPFKFISVFLTAATLGPVWGGVVALLGDILNVFLAPSGAWLPPITVIEFLYGFVFGIFFYKRSFSGKSYILRTILCLLVLFIIDLGLTSFILKSAGYFPTFLTAVGIRSTAAVIKIIIQGIFILISSGYMKKFRALVED